MMRLFSSKYFSIEALLKIENKLIYYTIYFDINITIKSLMTDLI